MTGRLLNYSSTIRSLLYFFIIMFFPLIALMACQAEQEKQKKEIAKPVKTMTIGTAEKRILREFPGKVEAGKNVELSFQVSGKIIEFPVMKGQAIKQNDLIARIDPIDFQLKVNEATANLNEAKFAFERAGRLLEKDFVSQAEYDQEKARYEIAEANLKLTEQNLEYTYLYAPFDGKIADTYPDTFQFINAKEPVALLHDISYADIAIDVPESIMIQIQNIDVLKKEAVFEAAPEISYPVTYKKHSSEADPSTQTYRVYLTLPAPKGLSVLPGMTATVKVNFARKDAKKDEGFYLIPSSAVFADEKDKQFVWKIDPKTSRIHATPVTTRNLSNHRIRIDSGLAPGDQIVTAGVHFLREGQLVRSLEENTSN